MGKIHAHLEEHGFVESRFGRRRNLNLAGMTEKERGHALRQAGNFPIQSTGADICNLAAIAVDRELRTRKMKSCLIHSIHDSLIIDVHPKEEKVVSELVVNIMQNKIPGSLKWLRVPLEVDVEISPRWGKAEKVA
jgi:DNA polymerase-1